MISKATTGYEAWCPIYRLYEASQTKEGSCCLWRLPNVRREAGGADNPLDGLGGEVTHLGRWINVSSDVEVDGDMGGLGLIVRA